MRNVVQIKSLKHYTNISVLKSVYFTLFHSYLTSSILNWGRANKTTLLPLIRLQNKAMRTIEYSKTKTTVLCSKCKILEIPDLFQLSVAKFMFSFHHGGLPNHFDNYFAEIASVHKYQKRLASLQKYYLSRMKTSLGQLALKQGSQTRDPRAPCDPRVPFVRPAMLYGIFK